MFQGSNRVLNQPGDVSLGKATEDLPASLRQAIGDLQAQFFDLEAGLLRNFHLSQLGDRQEKLAFWINLYNTMVIHGVIDWGGP